MCIDYCSFSIWKQIADNLKKNEQKMQFYTHNFSTKTDYHYVNNYDKIMGPLLTFSITRAIICEFVSG